MVISRDQFARDLVAIGLVSEQELSAYLDGLPPESRLRDAESLAQACVRDHKLTKYQAGVILDGKARDLVFGEHVLLKKIGEGGMGQVFKAVHLRMERLAAIKVLSAKSLDSPDAVKRFRQEVKVAARLNHRNIVATYDASEKEGVHYLVMECVDGCDLSTLVKRGGRLPVAQAIGYLIQAARGLEYAHARGAVHRDIKPANLLLDSEGTIKISDMSLARIKEPRGMTGATLSERLTKTGQMLGTVDYISPEQAEDTRSADHRSDVYSLGCTLYRLLTANPVYAGHSAVVKLMAHCEAEIPALSDALPGVPEKLNQVFTKMLAKRPEDRYQSMTEVIAELEACLGPARQQAAEGGLPERKPPAVSVVDAPTDSFHDVSPVAPTTTDATDAPGSDDTTALQATQTLAAGHGRLPWTGASPVAAGRSKIRLLLGIGAVVVAAVLALILLNVLWD